MRHSDLVSVILPVYNVERYLEECINSVISQTYKNLEIILVDDGATDSSGEMCDEFAKGDERIKVVHKQNGGLNMARKSGFEVSTGDWITFVDSDDVIDERYVEYLLEGVKKHRVEMSLCGYQYFVDEYQPDDKKLTTYTKPLNSTINMYLLDGRPDEHFFMQTAWGKLFSRRLISLIDWDFSNYRVNEDEFMSMMYYSDLKTPLAIVDNRLLYYRQRPDSIMGLNEKEYKNFYSGKVFTKFEYLGEVYDKRLERFGQKYENEIAYWFGLHYMISLSRAYSRDKDPLTKDDKRVFNDKLTSVVRARKKYRYWNEHGTIMDNIEKSGGIDGFFEYKKSSPTVSIVVPVYNSEKFLDQSLSSIANQSYSNLEVILVNDGSTDKSAEICDLFAKRDYRMRLINKENGGVSSARNIGLDAASGAYIMFVDSDDFLEFDAVCNLLQAAKKDNYKSDIYVGGIYDYHSVGYCFDYQPNDLPLGGSFTYREKGDTVYQIMTSINSPFAKIFDRRFIERNELRFDESIRIGEDALFVFQAMVSAKGIYRIDSLVYYYRNDFDNSYSATGTIDADKALDFTRAFVAMSKFVNEKKLDSSKVFMQQFRRGILAHTIYNLGLAERDVDAHKKVFRVAHDDVFNTYRINEGMASDGAEKYQVRLILAGDYDQFTLAKLNEYKQKMHGLIDEKHSLSSEGERLSMLRRLARKASPYLTDRQKRFMKKSIRRVRRELSRIK